MKTKKRNLRKQSLSNQPLKKMYKKKVVLDKLISENFNMVKSIAHRYKYYFKYLELDDLISEGIYGLYEAKKHFNINKKVKFSTYAQFWVKKYMQKYIMESFTMLKVPTNVLRNLKEILNYVNSNDKKISFEEISKKLNFDLEKVKGLLVEQLKSKRSLSLDRYLDDTEQEESFYDIVQDKTEQTPDEILQKQEKKDYLYNLLSTLSNDEAEVVKLRFGLLGNESHTLKEISKKLNISPQKVKELEVKSLMKLKKINQEKE